MSRGSNGEQKVPYIGSRSRGSWRLHHHHSTVVDHYTEQVIIACNDLASSLCSYAMKLISTVHSVSLPAPLLPVEVLSHIVSYIDESDQKLFNSCCLVSRSWYSASIARLYAWPKLTGKNFDKFARTICPPIGAHVRHVDLAGLVKRLDMGSLVYSSSKSLTARLLRRVRRSLESFVADATSFS